MRGPNRYYRRPLLLSFKSGVDETSGRFLRESTRPNLSVLFVRGVRSGTPEGPRTPNPMNK